MLLRCWSWTLPIDTVGCCCHTASWDENSATYVCLWCPRHPHSEVGHPRELTLFGLFSSSYERSEVIIVLSSRNDATLLGFFWNMTCGFQPSIALYANSKKSYHNQGGVKLSKNTLQMSNSKFLQHALKMSKMQFYSHARSKFLTSDLIWGQYSGFVFTIFRFERLFSSVK